MSDKEVVSVPKNHKERSLRLTIRAAWAIIIVAFVLVIGLQIQIQRRNEQLDRIEDATNELVEFTHQIQQDDTPDPELQRVFKAVFDTLSLLCEQFPDSAVCAQG